MKEKIVWTQEDSQQYWAAWIRKQRRTAFSAALAGRAKQEENRTLNRLERWFYTLKALICLLLRCEKQADEMIIIATWSYFTDQEGDVNWIELIVGYGLLCSWRCTIRSNGTRPLQGWRAAC